MEECIMEKSSQEEEGVKAVVIQHVSSRNVNTKAIKWALKALSLGPTDELTLLPILFTSSVFSFPKPQQRNVEEEIAKRKQEYQKNAEIIKISKQCQIDKIQFRIEVLPGPYPEVAVNAANNLRATLVILDREMKKYKKYFMESLSCGIILMKRNNSIEHLKGPTQTGLSQRGNSIPINCSRSSLIKKLTGNPIKKTQLQSQTRKSPTNRELDMARGYCLLPFTGTQETNHTEINTSTTFEQQKNHHINNHEGRPSSRGSHQVGSEKGQMYAALPLQAERLFPRFEPVTSRSHGNNHEEEVKDSICSQCKNTRPKFGHQRDFTYSEIHAATKGFCPTNFLSEGGFGSVYKGEIHGLKIAVKQHRCETSLQGEKEFKSEVNVLSKARHENVVMLLGSCSEGHNRLLVYEYVCNGSLDQHLSQYSRKPINWADRIKVAFGAAKGLLYLHENNIIHRDLRPNNILITHDYEAMLGDFGLARLSVEESLYSTEVVGTLGYMAPEYAESGKASTKTDVYSFGVILLQLITGMRTTDKRLGDKSLVGWARPLLKERNYPDLIDERMMDTHDCHQLFWMIRLAEKCLSRDSRKRLTINTVVNALSQIVDGSTCSVVLRDCSSSTSDSSYDTSDFPESQGDDIDEDGNFYGGSTPISSSMSHMSLRLPPSPPMGTAYSCTSRI